LGPEEQQIIQAVIHEADAQALAAANAEAAAVASMQVNGGA
jgi:importin-7